MRGLGRWAEGSWGGPREDGRWTREEGGWEKRGFILDSYFSILSIPPARAKLFREAWLILSEKDRFVLHSLFFKSTEYIIRCWTFNVRCSTFIF